MVRPLTGVQSMKNFFIQFFTWWNGATVATRFHTWLHGEFVGTDMFGNRYFQTKGQKKDPALGFVRRWVIYNGVAEASRIPPGWYGWMLHKTDEVPGRDGYQAREWEQPHQPNLTGTPFAHRPSGSILRGEPRAKAMEGYQPWTPSA